MRTYFEVTSVLQYVRFLAHLPSLRHRHGECVLLLAILSCSLPYQQMAVGIAHSNM